MGFAGPAAAATVVWPAAGAVVVPLLAVGTVNAGELMAAAGEVLSGWWPTPVAAA
jgi:hypothetical protein